MKKTGKFKIGYVIILVILVLVAVLALMIVDPTKRPGSLNPLSDLYYTKYNSTHDTQACIDEWEKYHPGINDRGAGYVYSPPPCPGVPQ